jgi:hypothetical protein
VFRLGMLYSVRYRHLSVVVAATDAPQARDAFIAWAWHTHKLTANPSSVQWPNAVKSIGDRPLLIADREDS